MGLFSRKPAKPAPVASSNVNAAPSSIGVAQPDAAAIPPTGSGPYDISQVPELGVRADLGALRIPVVPGMQVRMELDRATQAITGVTVMLQQPGGMSSLQLQAFAAPKTMGIWDEIREEIATGIKAGSGTVDDVPGELGRELIAHIPRQTPGGGSEMRKAGFIGHDGPRWFLRGVITGPAAGDVEAAQQLEDIFRNTVVVRDDSPKPPRDLLPLSLPGTAQKMPGAPDEAKPNIDPFKRGPEITETR